MDTSTWLSSAISINYYPDKLWKILNYTDSRPLTVLPILIPSWLGINLSYALTNVVTILCWLGIIFYFYKSIALFIDAKRALLITWTLCLFISTTWSLQHTAYNSEHISIFFITLATYLYVKFEKTGQTSGFQIFTLGIILGSLIYAKFQNAPMGLVIAAFAMLLTLRLKNYTFLALLILGGILPTLLINLVFIYYHKLSDFWINYFWNYLLYSYSTQFQSLPTIERFNPIRIGKFILNVKSSRIYFFALIPLTILGVSYTLFRSRITSSFEKINGYFSVLMVATSLYAIGQSGNLFSHYILYLFIPVLYCIAAFIPYSNRKISYASILLLVLVSLIQAIYNVFTIPPESSSDKVAYETQIVDKIRQHSTDKDNIVIWGWVDRWYVQSNRACGYRMPHSHHLFMKSDLYAHRIANFIGDMEENKPEIFIDTMESTYPMAKGLGKAHEYYAEVKAYVGSKYHLISTIDQVRIFKRNP
ncbi:hypothetical protein BWI96_01755 [Siphonobacter sp. SORGH_AS_0500]|uniref:hypothetical protein n=1 Tax=Siphonobacter sp. SORGH_AS_0500 TaxID=1864824 RepID=UPI000CAD7F4F|nr:hypothetical protein [Siphonobacter sp. SORGH_AS_0500]PKK38520.1 hypothetical protein BWI96_01755 [Siphonobacter sp. SORGH_AS_0500]